MRPLAAPDALWVLSRAGKVPRPPAGGRNLSQGTDFLWKAGESPALLFVLLRVSPLRRRPKGFPVALWKPSGFHPLRWMGGLQKINFLWKAGESPALLFFVSLRVSPLRRRPKGFPVALWKPSGFHPLRGMGATKNGLLWKARKMPALLSLYCIGFRSSKEIMTRL